MKILIINWRSIKDPLEGGAERATIEHAKRWVKDHGAEVTWLCPRYDKKIDSEVIDGVKFHYIGFPLKRNISEVIFTYPIFYFLVFWTYLTKFKGKVDVVIDQVHGIPYLTSLYVKEKIVVYIHEVAGEIWDIMYPFPINHIGRFLEKLIYPTYRNVYCVGPKSVSGELIKVGIDPKRIITVNYGVTTPKSTKIPPKSKDLTVLFLNRLVKMKGPERTIDVFNEVIKKDKNAKLIFVGGGEKEYVDDLKKKVKSLKIEKSVIFKGRVSEKEKFDLLAVAHVLLNGSYKEGWGLVNIEANTVGTPVVSFNVLGNRESVKEGVSGYLFEENEIVEMASAIIRIRNDEKLRLSAINYSRQFDWDKVSNEFYEVLKK